MFNIDLKTKVVDNSIRLFYSSKNEHNQIINTTFTTYEDHTINVCFYISTKRKQGYQDNIITGKGGIKSLIWAKNCILDFIEQAQYLNFKDYKLCVYPSDHRRRVIYERYLIPLGFKIEKDQYRQLIYKL